MEVKCVWRVVLPFKFILSENLEAKKIYIDDISILPIKTSNSNFCDSLEIEYDTDIDDQLIPKDDSELFKTIEFKMNVTKRVGFKVNKFVNAYYRQVENYYVNQVFNGDGLNTYYEMCIFDKQGRIIDKSILSNDSDVRLIDDELFNKIINDINQKEKDIVEEFMRMATCFLENGYFEMSIMNLSAGIESFIKRFILLQKGLKAQDLNDEKGLLDKFFHSGLKQTIGISLKEEIPEWYEILSIIVNGRNEIAHGGSLYKVKDFKKLKQEELYDFIEDLILEVKDIFEWILNKDNFSNSV